MSCVNRRIFGAVFSFLLIINIFSSSKVFNRFQRYTEPLPKPQNNNSCFVSVSSTIHNIWEYIMLVLASALEFLWQKFSQFFYINMWCVWCVCVPGLVRISWRRFRCVPCNKVEQDLVADKMGEFIERVCHTVCVHFCYHKQVRLISCRNCCWHSTKRKRKRWFRLMSSASSALT